MSIFTAPTTITFPFFRLITAESSIGSLLGAAAVIITLSNPWPSVKLSIAVFKFESFRSMAPSVPLLIASSIKFFERSTPKTRQPFAFNNCTVSWPRSPRPITQTLSPYLGSACRTPCKAIAPKVVKLASSKETLSGILTTKFCGIATTVSLYN